MKSSFLAGLLGSEPGVRSRRDDVLALVVARVRVDLVLEGIVPFAVVVDPHLVLVPPLFVLLDSLLVGLPLHPHSESSRVGTICPLPIVRVVLLSALVSSVVSCFP